MSRNCVVEQEVLNLMKQQGCTLLAPIVSLYLIVELLQVVDKLHACQIIHGDIKPDNILVRDMYVPRFYLIRTGGGLIGD